MNTELPEPAEEQTSTADDVYAASGELLENVIAALDANDGEALWELVEGLHSADTADLVALLKADRRRLFFEFVGDLIEPEVLVDLDEAIRDDVFDQLGTDNVAAAVTELDTDDAIELLEDLDESEQQEVLEAVPAAERAHIEAGLSYPEDSAGRLMQRELIAVPEFWTVGQTIDYLRESADLPDEFYEIFVVDPAHRPIGTVPLNRAMRTKRPFQIGDIMEDQPRLIPVDMDQEDVAYLFQQYDLTSAAVVSETGRLVGVIMIDDVVDVIHEEAEEDIMRLGGVREADLYDSVLETTRTRFSWLLINLGTAIIASLVIALFDTSIEKIVALAILMPIVASMGGNAGTQTLTVAVRALAMHDLTPANAVRIVVKEVLVGGINGVLFAVLMGALAALWFQDLGLGSVLAAAMVINLLVAGLSGILIPLTLNRMDIDPAVASTVFVTTITDVVGFFAFLGLAAWLLL